MIKCILTFRDALELNGWAGSLGIFDADAAEKSDGFMGDDADG